MLCTCSIHLCIVALLLLQACSCSRDILRPRDAVRIPCFEQQTMNMNANIPWTMFPCSQGDVPDTPRMLQALYNAVISSSVDDEEDEEALKLLSELLAEEGVDPNAGDEALWSNVSPLLVPQSKHRGVT